MPTPYEVALDTVVKEARELLRIGDEVDAPEMHQHAVLRAAINWLDDECARLQGRPCRCSCHTNPPARKHKGRCPTCPR